MTNDKNRAVHLTRKEGQSDDAALAECAFAGTATHAFLASNFYKGTLGSEISVNDSINVLNDRIASIHNGDIGQIESMLALQASTLDAIFCEFTRRAAANIGEYLGATDTYLRLALKAQSQCRTTLVALADIKNPKSVSFVKQANIATNQQVNNSPLPAEEIQKQPNELLLEEQHHETMDIGGTTAASRTDTELEAVGKQHRGKNARGKEALKPERV